VLILAFRGDHAVVHLMSEAERMSLLAGDGIVPSGAEVEVPIMDDLAVFTGDFVLDTDRAWGLVSDFTQTRAAGPLGEWCEL
jgi:glyoxylate carboligase